MARERVEKCEAQLWLGRAWSKAGMVEESSLVYRAMLDECGDTSDDDGIPFALYAGGPSPCRRSRMQPQRVHIRFAAQATCDGLIPTRRT